MAEIEFRPNPNTYCVVTSGPEKTIALLLENYSTYFDEFTCWLSGERSLPFELLVNFILYGIAARK